MRQIEVTSKVLQSLEEVNDILLKQGFELKRKSRVEDKYMTQFNGVFTEDNLIEVLQKSVLVRYLCENGKDTFKRITYKNKIYKDDIVISEKKYSVKIDSISKAVTLLQVLGFKKIVDVKYDVIVYKKGDLELAFQDVENLGLLVEYENKNDFEDKSNEEIIEEKKKMLEEIRSYNLKVDDNYDVKKAFELLKNKYKI